MSGFAVVHPLLVLAQTTTQDVQEDTGFQWTLVIACWSVVLLSLLVLVVRTIQRGRRLSAQVPEEQRRWM